MLSSAQISLPGVAGSMPAPPTRGRLRHLFRTSALAVTLLAAATLAGTTATPAHASSSTLAPSHRLSSSQMPAGFAHLSAAGKRAAFGSAVLSEASRHAGAPYVYGAGGPSAFDCSGFTSYVYARFGFHLAHSSYAQYAQVMHIPQSQARPGDLIFLNGLGHVAIYAGQGMMWDAPSPGGAVHERPIYSSAYRVGRLRL